MSNRRKPQHPTPPQPDLFQVALVIDPDDHTTAVHALFRMPTFGEVSDAAKTSDGDSVVFWTAIAERTYQGTHGLAGADLVLSWDELQGVLAGPDVIGRIKGHEKPSQLHRVLAELYHHCGLPGVGEPI